jgi:hypothetical protein
MTVKKYRDVSDMPPPAAGRRSDPATYRRVAELWQFSARLAPALYPPGVYKFRSIEESEAARERATIERMRVLRAKRRGG